jgi:DNA-binding CsgD family transcriptional regulator
MFLDVLDQLSVGIVLVDRNARVIFANAAAKSLSAENGQLRLDGSVTTTSSTRHLGELIRSVLGSTAVRTMSLPPSHSGRPLTVLVSSVRGEGLNRSDVSSLRNTAALVVLCDPDRPAQIPPGWVMDAYGLTMAEARVALAMSMGTTTSGTARRLRLSPNTVKTHLRRVYEKTGTHRQAELSRLMATFGLALVRAHDAQP